MFTYKGTEYPAFEPRQRLTHEQRNVFRGYVIEAHRRGASIRAISRDTGRGYGTVHEELAEAGELVHGRRGGRNNPGTTRELSPLSGRRRRL